MAKKTREIVPIDLDGMITLPQAAKLVDVCETYMRVLIKKGKVRGVKFGRNYLVDKKSALAFQRIPGAGRPKSR